MAQTTVETPKLDRRDFVSDHPGPNTKNISRSRR